MSSSDLSCAATREDRWVSSETRTGLMSPFLAQGVLRQAHHKKKQRPVSVVLLSPLPVFALRPDRRSLVNAVRWFGPQVAEGWWRMSSSCRWDDKSTFKILLTPRALTTPPCQTRKSCVLWLATTPNTSSFWSTPVAKLFTTHKTCHLKPTPPPALFFVCVVNETLARHGMILFGDIDFFTSDSVRNKSGQRLWLRFLSLLEAGGHVYRDGLPVVCETHKTHADLSTPEGFDEHTPDGGCRLLCGAKLECGHPCPRRYWVMAEQ